MSWQILNCFAQFKIFSNARMTQVQASIAEAVIECVIRIAVLPVRYGRRKFVQCFLIKAEHFADFSRSHTAAIRNDVGGHGRAALAIASIQILDYGFAVVAARKIKINVRPLTSFLRQKPFEEQLHTDWIDRSNPQRITNSAVSGRTAPLYQNVLSPAELHQVPYDQKISRQL